MQVKFDRGFFGRLSLLVIMTVIFYVTLRPTPTEVTLRLYEYLDAEKLEYRAYGRKKKSGDEIRESFVEEITVIYRAALDGHARAIELLLELQIYAKELPDAAKAEVARDIPGPKAIVKKYPKITQKIIDKNPKLKVFESMWELKGN
jgi:hypothetical protein